MTRQHLPVQLDEPPTHPPPDGEPGGGEQRPAQPTREPARGGRGIAWLALLAALAVAGWNGQQYMEQTRRTQSERALLNEQARRLGDLERRLAVSENARATQERSRDERQRAFEEALAGVRTLAGLRDRNGWVIAEAEYLIRLARHTLRVRDDAGTAIALLSDADRRLAELGDPALHTPRTLLAADIAALKNLAPSPVRAHATALARVMDQIEELPLPIRHVPANAPSGTPQPPTDRWQWRAWLEEAEQWLRQSVVLRRDGEAPRPLIAPAEHYFLAQNLRLTLEAARLALYRDDPTGFHDALGQARRWVVAHFDGGAAPTRGVLRELARLEQAPLTRELPDLEESLNALATLNAGGDRP